MRSILLTVFLVNIYFAAYDQTVSGIVFDNETHRPVPFANVFLEGTTMGTIANQSGYFNLPIPDNSKFPIAVSAIGYNSVQLSDYSIGQSISVFLTPKIYLLGEVTVRSKTSLGDRMKRKYYLDLFRRQFLGESWNAYDCKILNEKDIILQYIGEKDMIKAYSDNPLIIINKALGYTILYYMDLFEVSVSGELIRIYGNYTFKEDTTLHGLNKERALINRRSAFLGSRMEFFRSLWNNSLDSAGFRISDPHNSTLFYDSLVFEDDSGAKFLKRTGKANIAFHSRYADTQINILQDSVFFNRFGYFDPYLIVWQGTMAKQRIGDMLPFDYVYDKPRKRKSGNLD